MAAAAAGSGRAPEEGFGERELEVAAILADLPSIVRASNRRRRQQQKQKQQQARPEIPSWGRSRPRKAPAATVAAPPAEKPAVDDDRSEGVASPDTPLAFPEDDEHSEAAAAAAAEDKAKACAQDKWAQEQRGVVASLSHENAHLLKQIEDFRARLQTSRSTNDSLKQIQQSKHKKRHRPEEEDDRIWKLQARAADRPALDLNEPAEADAEDGRPPQIAAAAAQWVHRGHHHHQQQLMQMQHKAARRRRQEIRRAKAAAGRTRRQG